MRKRQSNKPGIYKDCKKEGQGLQIAVDWRRNQKEEALAW
jgi:hypothetical protein